jgi:hypothetical protein
MEEALVKLSREVALKVERRQNLDETIDNIVSGQSKLDIKSTLEKVYNVFYKGKHDITKVVNWYITDFLENKWTHNLQLCELYQGIVSDYLEASYSRSAYSKLCYFRSILKIVCITIQLDVYHDWFQIYHQHKLNIKVQDLMLQIENIKSCKICKKYFKPFIPQQYFILINGLSYFVRHKHYRYVNVLLQYILSKEHLDQFSCSISDDFGLFADIKDEYQSDPQWHVWFFIVIFIKHNELKEQRKHKPANFWMHIGKVTSTFLYIVKATYSTYDRQNRIMVLMRLYDIVSKRNFQEESRNFEFLDSLNQTVNTFLHEKGIDMNQEQIEHDYDLIKLKKPKTLKKKNIRVQVSNKEHAVNAIEQHSEDNVVQEEQQLSTEEKSYVDDVKQGKNARTKNTKNDQKEINMDYLMFCTYKKGKHEIERASQD